jgi:hypothetical protein
MQTKISFFISICVLLINGCVFMAPVPKDINETAWFIDSDSIDAIVRDQSVPGRISRIKGKTIDISFKNDICPCVGKIELSMRVSEVNSRGVKGYEKHSYHSRYFGEWIAPVVDSEQCKTFAIASDIIIGAEDSSIMGPNFFLPSYNSIWEAQRALGRPECDSIGAIILAEKAKQIAEDEGAKALGYNVTGTWVSEITSNHPDFFNKKEQRNLKLKIDERGNQITATDSSGEVILDAYRIEDSPYKREIKFKFSFPPVLVNQLEGEWKVVNGSTIEGSWNDPMSTASGKWNLWKTEQNVKAVKRVENLVKHLQKWLSRKQPLEIKWEEIDEIDAWTNDIDWGACWGFFVPIAGDGGCLDIGE